MKSNGDFPQNLYFISLVTPPLIKQTYREVMEQPVIQKILWTNIWGKLLNIVCQGISNQRFSFFLNNPKRPKISNIWRFNNVNSVSQEFITEPYKYNPGLHVLATCISSIPSFQGTKSQLNKNANILKRRYKCVFKLILS